MNIKPAVLLQFDAAGTSFNPMVDTPENVLAEYRDRMKANGKGAAALIVLTGRGIEKRWKKPSDESPILPDKSAKLLAPNRRKTE